MPRNLCLYFITKFYCSRQKHCGCVSKVCLHTFGGKCVTKKYRHNISLRIDKETRCENWHGFRDPFQVSWLLDKNMKIWVLILTILSCSILVSIKGDDRSLKGHLFPRHTVIDHRVVTCTPPVTMDTRFPADTWSCYDLR